MHTDRKKPEIATAIYLEKRFPHKDGKCSVKLRITFQRKRKYYAIKGEYYTDKEFEAIMNPEGRGKNKEKRKKFEQIENTAIEIIDNVLRQFSFESFEKEYLKPRLKDNSVQSYFEAKASELDEKNKIQTATLYRSVYKSLTEFDGKINFQKITPDYLKKYEQWMLGQENSYTSIGIYMRHFKHIINRALSDGVMNEYPFGRDKNKYQIPVGRNTKKALTIFEIEKLFKYKTDNRNEYHALQYFLFSYLSNGMNMADVANLRYKNITGNNIEFYRQKTIDTVKVKAPIRVFLMPEIREIINSLGNEDKDSENYIFPIYNGNLSDLEKHKRLKQHIKQTNKYIRRVAIKLGIDEKVTTYYARHSYSTILKRSGASIEFIGEQLGHQNTKTTQSYLDSFEDEHRAKHSASLIDFKLDKQQKKD